MENWVVYDEVKAKVSFLDAFELYGLHDAAQKEGGDIVIVCPFHDGSKPLFKANPRKGVALCVAPKCGWKGNVIHFTAAMEELSYRNAALFLQGMFMKPKEQAPQSGKATSGQAPSGTQDTTAQTVNEPEEKQQEEVDELPVEDEVHAREAPEAAANTTPRDSTPSTSSPQAPSQKGRGYMREVEETLRDLLREGNDGETIKWVKAELYASYRRGKASPGEGPSRPREKAT